MCFFRYSVPVAFSMFKVIYIFSRWIKYTRIRKTASTGSAALFSHWVAGPVCGCSTVPFHVGSSISGTLSTKRHSLQLMMLWWRCWDDWLPGPPRFWLCFWRQSNEQLGCKVGWWETHCRRRSHLQEKEKFQPYCHNNQDLFHIIFGNSMHNQPKEYDIFHYSHWNILKVWPLINGLGTTHSCDRQDFLYSVACQTQLWSAPTTEHVA